MQYKKPMLQEYGALVTLTHAIGGSALADQASYPSDVQIPDGFLDDHGSKDFCVDDNTTPENDCEI